MGLTMGSTITGADWTTLKARVKNEMSRRNGYGSLAGYAAAAYDFTSPATAGYPIKEEHYDKTRDLVALINTTGIPVAKTVGELIPEMNTLSAKLSTYEAKSRYATSGNDCMSSCTGTCVSTCSGSCTNDCTGGCTSCNGCDGTCNTTCYGGCNTSCDGTCQGGCQGTCGGTCDSSCGTNCLNGCLGNCTNASYQASCGGCLGGCSSFCRSSN